MAKSMNGHNAIPVLGQKKPRAGVQTIGVLARDLDAAGTFEPESVQQLPNGQVLAVSGRSQYLTANDLLAEIRQIVREEIEAAFHVLAQAQTLLTRQPPKP